jgi:heme/copper-type cytochrome/quinol oxidase subunit 4
MKTFLRLSNLIAWSSAVIAILFLLLGFIQVIYGHILFFLGLSQTASGRLFGDTEIINFFIAASCFFLITIGIFIIQIKDQLKKE